MCVHPFTITNEIVHLISKISQKIGGIDVKDGLGQNLFLRKANRIRSIKSSLSIEDNGLTLGQVTDVINGKPVVGPKREIQEVKNASKAYDYASVADPFDIDDLLMAHGVMMRGLIPDAGEFRKGDIGIYEGNNLIHAGAHPESLREKMECLVEWAKRSDTHPLVKGCVFHYELEFIHPFSDGNGRMGRLWHHVLLSRWDPVFTYLPVETFVERRQKQYYDALGSSDKKKNSTPFITLMMHLISEALDDLSESMEMSEKDGLSDTERKVYDAILLGKSKTSSEIASEAGISTRTFHRAVSSLISKGFVVRRGSRKTGMWEAIK